MNGRFIILVAFIFTLVQNFNAQDKGTIRGFVYDSKTKYPLFNANVWIEGTNRGDVSDFKGYFELKNLEPGSYTLVFSYVGYKQERRKVELDKGEVKTVDVYLEEIPYFSVEEIVVLGRAMETYNQAEFGGRDISKRAPRDLGDFIKNFTNTSAIKKGGYALDPVIRGLKYDQVNVQIDNGMKIEPACPNRMDPPTSHVQSEDLEKVEILKGPYALRFGPNFGGVVNLVMARPKKTDKFEFGYSSAFSREFGFDVNVYGTKGRNSVTGEPLPEIPPFEARANLYYGFFEGTVVPELSIRAVARKSDISQSFGETPTPGFVLVNFLVNITYFKFFDVSFGVNNLFDKAYYEHLNRRVRTTGVPIYEPGRNFFVNIKMKVGR